MSLDQLVFDIGMHRCEDTAYYLAKGFRVVAVEANPALVDAARTRFGAEIASGALTIVDRALTARDDDEVTLYVNDGWTDWSSLHRGLAARDGTTPRETRVKTISLSTLVRRYGAPYYAKVDIEGEDVSCAAQLALLDRKPRYVSFELSDVAIFAHLYTAGYAELQFVNQALNGARAQADREGAAIEWRFSGDSSGPFGRDLPPDKWIGLETALDRFFAYEKLRRVDPELGYGWMDVHARRA